MSIREAVGETKFDKLRWVVVLFVLFLVAVFSARANNPSFAQVEGLTVLIPQSGSNLLIIRILSFYLLRNGTGDR